MRPDSRSLKYPKNRTHSLRVPISQWAWAKRQFPRNSIYEHLPFEDGSRKLRLYRISSAKMTRVEGLLIEARWPFDIEYADGRLLSARFCPDGSWRIQGWGDNKPDTPPSWENQGEYRKIWQTLQLLDPD